MRKGEQQRAVYIVLLDGEVKAIAADNAIQAQELAVKNGWNPQGAGIRLIRIFGALCYSKTAPIELDQSL